MPGSSRSAYKSRLSLSMVPPVQGRVPDNTGDGVVEGTEEDGRFTKAHNALVEYDGRPGSQSVVTEASLDQVKCSGV